MRWRDSVGRWLGLETRQGLGDSYGSWLLAQAAGTSGVTAKGVTRTAVIETAASLYGRCLAQAEVHPNGPRTRSVTPALLGQIGRECVRNGEWLALIRVRESAVTLLPASDWEIQGESPAPETWRVRCTLPTPDGHQEATTGYGGVVHVTYATAAQSPWSGMAPWTAANESARLLAGLERRLGEESSAPVGHLLPVPSGIETGSDEGADPLALLRNDIASAKGAHLLVETTQSGWEQGRASAPQSDWKPRRIGASPPAELVELRRDAEKSVLRACGIPEALYESAGATSAQQAWRQFLHAALLPFARRVEGEFREKLDLPALRLDMGRLTRTDLVHQSRIVGGLVKAGVGLERALGIAGLDDA